MSETDILKFAGNDNKPAESNALNVKAQKWQELLVKKNITCFGAQIVGDELHTVLFRTILDVNGQNLPLLVYTDDSLYTVIKVLVAPAARKAENEAALLKYLDEQNRKYKLFKYSTGVSGDVELDCCLLNMDDGFDAELLQVSIDVILEHLLEEYPLLMKVVWSAEAVDTTTN